MHVLYLTYDGLTDPLGQSQILPYLTGLSLHKRHKFTIISFEKKDNFQKGQDTILKLIEREGIDIQWIYLVYTKKPPILSTIYDLIRLYHLTRNLLKSDKTIRLLHCRSYLTALVGLNIKFTHKIPFIFDMRGFWADERVEGNIWNLSNPLYKMVYNYFKKKEKALLKEAEYIISLTENAKDEINSWLLKKTPLPIEVIPCCVDTALFDYHIYPQKQEDGLLKVIYLGSVGTWYLVDEMLLFFKELLQVRENSLFHWITKDDPDIILSKAQLLNVDISKIKIFSANRHQVPLFISKADVALFFIKPSYSKKASSPTKLAEILAMGIPIISNQGVGDNDFIFSKSNFGFLLSDFQTTSLKDLASNVEQILNRKREPLRQIALDYFSLEKGIEQYNSIYEKINPTD